MREYFTAKFERKHSIDVVFFPFSFRYFIVVIRALSFQYFYSFFITDNQDLSERGVL